MVKSNKKGLTLIILVFVILTTTTLIVIAYGFLITYEMKSGGIEVDEQKAFYIAETGIERAMEYLEDDTDWSNDNGIAVIAEDFGAGSYSVDLSGGTTTTIVVSSEATVGNAPRQVTRKIRQKIRRLPEAFNYALFWEGTGSAEVDKGTVDVNGGDVFTKGSVSDANPGTFDVADGGTPATTRGGFVYTTNSWTSSGTYTEGTVPGDEPSLPTLNNTYYIGTGGLITDFDTDINTYNTSASYLGYGGAWTADPNGTVSITLSGNILYYENFKAKNNSSISGSGAIVSDDEIKLENTTSVSPSGGTILLIAREKVEVKNTSSVGTNTRIYSQNDELKIKDSASVSSATLLSSDKLKIEGGTVNNSTLYSSDEIEIKGDSTTVSGSTILAGDKIKVKDEATVDSDSILYIPSTADKIEVTDANTSVDGSILSENKFKLDEGTVTGIIFCSEAELKEGTINGSVVTDSFKSNKIGANNKTLTINYDHTDYSYFPEAPAGLGLDIDGDASEEGIIVKVPGTWEQL